MAGNAARRIAPTLRIFYAASLLSLASLVNASWDAAHFCRLSDDRILISAGNQRFVLKQSAAWELADSSKKPAFDKWLNQAKLPHDYGQLVAGAPADHRIPLAGELDLTQSTDGSYSIQFLHDSVVSRKVKITATASGARIDADSESAFVAIAKAVSQPASTLLVKMADSSKEMSAEKAWGAFLARFGSKSEFFIDLNKKQGVLWVRKIEASIGAPATSVEKSTPTESAGSAPTESSEPRNDKKGDSQDTLPWIIGAVVAVGAGLGGYFLGSRTSPPKSDAGVPGPGRSPISATERELLDRVRDEVTKLGWGANHIPSADSFVAAQMIERYRGAEALKADIERLKSYRQFREAHDSFQAKIDRAESEAKHSAQRLADIGALLQQERAKVQTLTDEKQQALLAQSASITQVKDANRRIAELERRNAEFRQIYVELVSRTAAVCHDIVLTRPRGDAWALAFAYLVDYTLACLGLALQGEDKRTYDAMLINLSRLSDAMAKSFPDRKLVIDPWKRSVKAFGDVQAPSYEPKPHPHVDSLSQIVLTLRDTGPSLSDFREFYAPSEGGLHIIRPA